MAKRKAPKSFVCETANCSLKFVNYECVFDAICQFGMTVVKVRYSMIVGVFGNRIIRSNESIDPVNTHTNKINSR